MNNFQVNVSAIITKGEKVLLIQRSDDEDVYPGLWGIPGGKVDNTDTTLFIALQREIKEEVGIQICQGIKLVGNNIVTRWDKNVLYLTFLARYKKGTPRALEDTAEVGWFSLAELKDKKFTPFTKDLVILKLLAEKH